MYEDYYAFLALGDIILYTNGTKIISILKLPIVENVTYTMYSFMSLPTEKFFKKFFYIEVPRMYFSFTSNHTRLTSLDSMNNCKIVFGEKICKRQYITRSTNTVGKCINGILLKNPQDRSIKLFSLDSDFILKIKTNMWYIIPVDELHLNLVCANNYMKTIKISVPTIATLFQGCMLINNDYVLRSSMDINMKETYYHEKLFMNVSIPNIHNIDIPKLRITHFDDLEKDAISLKETEVLISNYENVRRNRNITETSLSAINYAGYVAILLFVLIILYKCMCFCRRN